MSKTIMGFGLLRIRFIAMAFLALGTFGFAIPRSATQGTGRCRVSGDEADVLLGASKRLAANTDSVSALRRQRYHIPATDSINVTLVTADSVCALAGDAYNANLDSAFQVVNRAVYVVKIGTVYMVCDPSFVETGSHGYIPNGLVPASWSRRPNILGVI